MDNNTAVKFDTSKCNINNIAAKPNHETVVKCHAKRSVCLVKTVEPNKTGNYCLNSRMSMKRSPK